MRTLLPLIAALALVPLPAHAQQMYKCTVDGRTSYSDQPCPAGAGTQQKIQVDAPPPARDDAGVPRMPRTPSEPYTARDQPNDGLTSYERNVQAMQRTNDLNERERACVEREMAGDTSRTHAEAERSLAFVRQFCAAERQDYEQRTAPRNR